MFLVAGGDLRFENVDVRQEDLGELELTEDGLVLAGWGFGRELGQVYLVVVFGHDLVDGFDGGVVLGHVDFALVLFGEEAFAVTFEHRQEILFDNKSCDFRRYHGPGEFFVAHEVQLLEETLVGNGFFEDMVVDQGLLAAHGRGGAVWAYHV